jgi:DNA polymerase-3 subunit alpha
MTVPYVPLRAHSEYSVIHGLGSIPALLDKAQALGFTAIGLTDACNIFAAIKLYKEARSRKMKPIFGTDLCLAEGKSRYPFTIFCQNELGFKNMTKLISHAYLKGRRENGIPLLERSWLTPEVTQGLIALSGGALGEIGTALLQQDETAIMQGLEFWQALFPEQRFYLEIFRIGAPDEEIYISKALQLATQHKIPVVATHPSYFLTEADFNIHEVRVAIHEGFTLDDPNRPKRFSDQQYFMSSEAMNERFADCPTALENAAEIAKRCNVTFTLGKAFLPKFPIPEGLTEADYFRQEAHAGMQERFQVMNVDQQRYLDRLNLEVDMINQMGFTGYFLIVADFIQWSKKNGVPVGPGRGSGAGSLVAFALKITDIDPLPYDLLFERFLNPERVSMPDFDIDFCMEGRDRVIDYVAEKYGRYAVSQIITFGTMAAKAVIRDVGRVLALPYGFVDGIAKLIPLDLGTTLQDALDKEPQLKRRYDEEEEVKSLIDMALKLEGTVRNVGKHAGGVVIAPTDLTDFTAIYCEEGSEQLVAQYDKEDVEAAGLVKFDFLGLRNLTIIQAAVDNINQRYPERKLDISLIPLDDAKTFEMLKKGDTTAVFQLESRGMKDLIKRLSPDTFEDIIALVALFRPGPLGSGMVDDFINRKHGRAKIEYPHPDTAPILKSTYGVILYQEQVMLIPQVLAGYTLGGADLLRRAMGKKKPEEMAKQRSVFIEGAQKNHISEEVSGPIFDLMEKFAGYGFNKSHSAAYALVAYQTAYLKAHYPAEFMAAVLSSDMDNTDKVVGFVEECKAMHLTLQPPHIQQSIYPFSVIDERTICYGLGAIKGVGQIAIELMLAEREEGSFIDLFDFCKRVDLRKVNKRVLEALIYSGAMDSLGPNRSTLLASLETAMQEADQHEKATDAGQEDLFGLFGSETPNTSSDTTRHWKITEPASNYERVMQEKQVLGWCLSGHPLDEYRNLFKALKIQPLSQVNPTGRGECINLAGLVLSTRKIKTKRGTFLMVIELEDFSGKMDVTCFSEVMDEYQPLLKPEAKVVIEAEIQPDDFSGGLRGVAKRVHDLQSYKSSKAKRLTLTLQEKELTEAKLVRLMELLRQHRGNCPLAFCYEREDAMLHCTADPAWSVNISDELLDALSPYSFEVTF